MQQRSLDALLVSGGTHENPCMYYLANGAKAGTSTLAIKQRGHDPVLIVVGMERDEAAALESIRTSIATSYRTLVQIQNSSVRLHKSQIPMALPDTHGYSRQRLGYN